MSEEKKSETINGVISKILPKERKSEKSPFASVQIEGDTRYFTLWSESLFNSLAVGDKVTIDFTTSTQDYNGKSYTNHNIQDVVKEGAQLKLGEAALKKIEEVKRMMDKTGKTANNFTKEETEEVVQKMETIETVKIDSNGPHTSLFSTEIEIKEPGTYEIVLKKK